MNPYTFISSISKIFSSKKRGRGFNKFITNIYMYTYVDRKYTWPNMIWPYKSWTSTLLKFYIKKQIWQRKFWLGLIKLNRSTITTIQSLNPAISFLLYILHIIICTSISLLLYVLHIYNYMYMYFCKQKERLWILNLELF